MLYLMSLLNRLMIGTLIVSRVGRVLIIGRLIRLKMLSVRCRLNVLSPRLLLV